MPMTTLVRLVPILVLALGVAACSDYRDDDYYDEPPAPAEVGATVFVSDGFCYYWAGDGYWYWNGYGYHPWVWGQVNYYYGPRGSIVVGGPRGCVGARGVLPPPPGAFRPILRGPPGRLGEPPRLGAPPRLPGPGRLGAPPRPHFSHHAAPSHRDWH
jgi:hypothetical protein